MRATPLVAITAFAASLLGATPVQADSGGAGTTPNDSGSAPISATIEKFGQSICPSLVKPGSSLATTLSELQGNTGLTPTLTGMVAGFVIQTQCPAVMTQISKGDLSALNLKLPGPDPAGQSPSGLDLSALLKPNGPQG
jgi:hypothetical protein